MKQAQKSLDPIESAIDGAALKRRPGRPVGHVRQALLRAVEVLIEELRAAGSPFQGPTLQEIITRARVRRQEARVCITHCKRSGALQIVGERRVDYRNRPVAEYALGSGQVAMTQAQAANAEDVARLTACLQSWARPRAAEGRQERLT